MRNEKSNHSNEYKNSGIILHIYSIENKKTSYSYKYKNSEIILHLFDWEIKNRII